MTQLLMNPLTAPPPPEVPLRNAPLVCVLAQIRFPLITSIGDPAFIGPFQEAIRRRYPTLREDRTQALMFGSQGAMPGATMTTWRFSDDAGWQVVLAANFLALQTSHYTSRIDFIDRFSEIITALETHIGPGSLDRLGIRYIDRVVNAGVDDMRQMIQQAVLGIADTPLAGHASHTITESLLNFDNRFLLARWGHLPPQATLDPTVMEPIDSQSWVLDLDAYVDGPRAFDADDICSETRLLAERAYAFFRWAVTDVFLRRYGGEP